MIPSRGRSVVGTSEDESPTERALRVLEMVARSGSVSINDLMTAMGVPKTTAHRLLTNLEDSGFIQKSFDRGQFIVAPRLLEMAADITQSAIMQAPVHAVLMDLTRRTGETSSLGMMRGTDLIYVDSATADSPLTLLFQTGQKAPLYCTSSGRVVLAHMDKRRLDSFLLSGPWERLTPFTISEPEALAKEVSNVKTQGYATSESEFVVGVVGAAVPVYGPSGKLVACVSISAPLARKSLNDIVEIIPLMQNASKRITRILEAQGHDEEE